MNLTYDMKSWFFWAGISFVLGGFVSLAINLGVQDTVSRLEDMTGYSIGWIAVGIVLIFYSMIKGKKERK